MGLASSALATLVLHSLSSLRFAQAATGYMGSNPLCGMYKTQTVSFQHMLECGVRALDYRPYYVQPIIGQGAWKFWHGPSSTDATAIANYYTDQTIESTIGEITGWAAANPEELVILVVTHCGCFNVNNCCNGASTELGNVPGLDTVFQSLNFPVLDCDVDLASASEASIMNISKLNGGGHAIAMIDHCAQPVATDNWGLFADVTYENFTHMKSAVQGALSDPGATGDTKPLWEIQVCVLPRAEAEPPHDSGMPTPTRHARTLIAFTFGVCLLPSRTRASGSWSWTLWAILGTGSTALSSTTRSRISMLGWQRTLAQLARPRADFGSPTTCAVRRIPRDASPMPWAEIALQYRSSRLPISLSSFFTIACHACVEQMAAWTWRAR